MKFVDVKNDIAFRKIFGNENKKVVLISFLNAVLEFPNGKKVVDVKIVNPYQLPNLSGGKSTIVDVKAQDQSGNFFIVEMQVAEAESFSQRVLYYTSQSYSSQIERGDDYAKLNPTFFIGILDFEIGANPNYFSRHKVLDVETGEHLLRDVEFNFIELPKFKKAENEIQSVIEQWVYFIKNAENLNVIPDSIQDQGLKTAFEEADKHNWSKFELDEYNKIFIREADDEGRRRLGERRAMLQGELKGKLAGKLEIARKLLDKGLAAEFIAEATGLTVEEINALRGES
jgi:predicted transposase/invertase (TIGR01784 family)